MIRVESFSARSVARFLAVATALVCALGLASEVGFYVFGFTSRIGALFSLSEEANLPTWYSSLLLAACGSQLAAVGGAARGASDPRATHWTALSVIFVYLSLDEAIQIHEFLSDLVDGEGVFYFSWVLPAAAILVVLALVFARFVRDLPPITRRRFVVAGVIYVGGALVCELPLGAWTERHGDDNLGYALIDFVEESLEMVGAGAFLVALVDHRAGIR